MTTFEAGQAPLKVWIALSGLLLAAAPALAQPTAPASPPQRVTTLIIFGNDPCPRGKGDEIIVCARRPESERYRLPRRFREQEPEAAQQSWASRAMALENASRAGMPNSCSPVGSGGQTGCVGRFLRQAREERRQAEAEAAGTP